MTALLLTLALTGCFSSSEPPEPQPAQVRKTPRPTPRPSPAAVAEADAEPDAAPDAEPDAAPDAEPREPSDEAQAAPDAGDASRDEASQAETSAGSDATDDAANDGLASADPSDADGATADAPGKDSDEPAAEEPAEQPDEEAAPEPDVEEPPPEPTPAGATTYALDPNQGLLWVQVFKDPDTVAAALSHDHIIAAYGWSGTATWDAEDPSKCAVSIKVPVSGLDPDAPSLRKMVGLEGELSESQRGEVKGHMLGKSQLNSSKYGTIRFTSTSCSSAGKTVTVTGDLSIRGQAAPVTASLSVTADGATFTAKGSFTAKATDFGFDPYSAMMGALKNRDKMTFGIDVVGAAQ